MLSIGASVIPAGEAPAGITTVLQLGELVSLDQLNEDVPLGWCELHQVAILADADCIVVDFDRWARTALGTERDGFRHQLSPPFIVH